MVEQLDMPVQPHSGNSRQRGHEGMKRKGRFLRSDSQVSWSYKAAKNDYTQSAPNRARPRDLLLKRERGGSPLHI